MLKNSKISGTKNASFFLRAPTHYIFTFNLRFLYKLKHKLRLSKTVCGISHFDPIPFFLKFIFLFNMDSLTLKRYDSFQNENNRKATHSFPPRSLIFKLEQEVLKFNDIFVSWSSAKLT